MRKNLILLLVSLTLIISCSVSQPKGEESSEARLADMVLTDGRFTLYQKDERPIVFTASRASFYAADNSAEIDEIAFSQHDENGELTLEGSADYGELNTEDKRLMLKGNVRLESMENGMLIISEGPLFFDAESQEIELCVSGKENASVSVRLLAGAMGDHNTFEAPETVKPQNFTGFERCGSSVKMTLPACSVAAITLE